MPDVDLGLRSWALDFFDVEEIEGMPLQEKKKAVMVLQCLIDEVTELRAEVAFWLDEGQPEWPPEMAEWRELAEIGPDDRTPEQTARVSELGRLIRWKSDARVQYDRAELLERKVDRRTLASYAPGEYRITYVSLKNTDGDETVLGVYHATLHVMVQKDQSWIDMHKADWLASFTVTGPLELVDYSELGLPHATEGAPYFEFHKGMWGVGTLKPVIALKGKRHEENGAV